MVILIILLQAFERYPISASGLALSYACVANIRGVDVIRINPAALVFIEKNYLAVGYEYTFCGIEDLHNIGLGFARPIAFGGFGIAISEFGFSEETEQTITPAMGIGLSKDFKLGIGFDLYIINNKRTGTCFGYGLNLGMIGVVMKKWSLGIYGHNLNQPQFGNGEIGQISPLLQAGIGYQPFNDISSEIDFSINNNLMRIHLGGEFKVFDFLFLRTGVRTNPQVVNLGIGGFYKFISIDYGVEYFPELPLTHILYLGYKF